MTPGELTPEALRRAYGFTEADAPVLPRRLTARRLTTPSDRELLRLLAADPDVRNLAARLTRRALLVAAALAGVGGLIVAITGGS